MHFNVFHFPQVADNTFPNAFSLMTGLTPTEANWTRKVYIDRQGYRFLWQDFADEGYRTFFAEDVPFLNIFNFAKTGFVDQPTHYYARTMEMAKDHHRKLFTEKGNCFGGIPNTKLMLHHLTEFSRLFLKKPHFGFIWQCGVTHGDLNGGSKVACGLLNLISESSVHALLACEV